MRIVVGGFGYVGSVTAACLIDLGHSVVAVDTNQHVVAFAREGRAAMHEPGVDERLRKGLATGRFEAASDWAAAAHSDIAMVCVGTDATGDGALNLGPMTAAIAALGGAIRLRPAAAGPLLVVVRSTIVPGTMTGQVLPSLAAAAGEGPGTRYQLAYNPEFMREGSGIADFMAPSRIVAGGPADAGERLLALYEGIPAPRFQTSYEAAEAIKFADNSFHALKVAFGNEIGRFAASLGIDAQTLAEMFLADTKLNISGRYLRPGLGFGGPCLPKDVAALVGEMKRRGVSVPVLENVLESNRSHEDFHLGRVSARAKAGARLLLCGLSFKASSPDLRGSPLVSIARRLVEAGYDLEVHDAAVPAEAARAAYGGRVVEGPLEGGNWDLVLFGNPPSAALSAELAGLPALDLYRL